MPSQEKKSYLVILGARPNFVKAAPFFRRARDYPNFKFTLVHTGQHFDDNMSKIFFEQMEIPTPDIQLDIKGEFHTEKIGKMFSALKEVIRENSCNGIIVFGDINSTLAGAVAAVSEGKQIIHIESGLRSHDRRMPEEINRAIVDHLSHHLFITEESGRANLLLEGIPEERLHMVGNIMIESIELFRDHFDKSTIIDELGLATGNYTVATIHRQENTDDPHIFERILDALDFVAQQKKVVIPLHPGTRQKIVNFGYESKLQNIVSIEPLGYIDFMKLVIDSGGVITDSGGIQEETSHLGIPCCTLRDNTERPITLTHGSNKLFATDVIDTGGILKHLGRSDFKARRIPLWDTEVSKRIFDVLETL
jgi:UDP-N-acetylglucosamine 2-epimerase (non-hydrolysing)